MNILRRKFSNESKTVAANFSYLLLLQIAGYVFPLITLPYLARVIGVDGFGKIAFAMAVIGYAQTVTDWGFNLTATRDIARVRHDLVQVQKIFNNVMWCRIVLMMASFAVIGILVAVIPYFRDNALIILLTFLLIPGHIMFPEWMFQGMEKMKYITILTFVSKLVFTCSIFLVIHNPEEYFWQPVLTALGYFVAGVLALQSIKKQWGVQISRFNPDEVWQTIKDGFNVFVNNLMPNFYNNWSILLMGFWGGSVANGIYEGGNKFNLVSYQFLNVLSRAFFPFLARHPEKHDMYRKINMGLAVAMALVLFFGAPILIKVFLSNSFDESIPVLQIMSVSIIFLALANIYGSNYLILHHQDKLLRNITVVCSVIGLLISFPLIYFFSYIGAALTICSTRGLLGIVTWLYARKYIKQEKVNRNINNISI